MKLTENTRERFLCGKDLNRLETSFVETSINVSLSFITSKDQLNKIYYFVSSCFLLFVEQPENKTK